MGAGAGAVSIAAGGEASGAEAGGDETGGVATGGAETGGVEAAGGLAGASGAGGVVTGAAAGAAAGVFVGGALVGAFAGEALLGSGAVVGAATGALEGGGSAFGEEAAGGGAVELEGLGLAAGGVDLVDAGVGAVANTTPTSPSTVFISAVAMHNHNIIHKYAILLRSEAIGSSWCCRNPAKAETLMLLLLLSYGALIAGNQDGKTGSENR